MDQRQFLEEKVLSTPIEVAFKQQVSRGVVSCKLHDKAMDAFKMMFSKGVRAVAGEPNETHPE